MSNVFWQRTRGGAAFLVVALGCASCAQSDSSGAVQVELIQPSGQSCQYAIAPATIQTLSSLDNLRGRLGRVVTGGPNVDADPAALDTGTGFDDMHAEFAKSGDVYQPLDYDSLYAVSLYYAVEQGHLLMSGLDASGDILRAIPNFADVTLIVHQAHRYENAQTGGPEVRDNAEFLSHTSAIDGTVRNFFFSYPIQDVTQMPLGLNLGVMVHEYGHLIFNNLVYANPRVGSLPADDATLNTFDALNEGLSDYFGFLATQDPGFFECSFPGENRDLSKPKTFDQRVVGTITSSQDFDPHEGGAIFAATNYEIGGSIGYRQNGKYLLLLESALANCAGASSGRLTLDFKSVAACHVQVASSAGDTKSASSMKTIYNKYLGALGSLP